MKEKLLKYPEIIMLSPQNQESNQKTKEKLKIH